MAKDYTGREIHVGDIIIYTPAGRHSDLEHAVVVGIEDIDTRNIHNAKLKLVRMEKETWKWDRTLQRNVATREWKPKKITINSPFRTLIIEPNILSNGDKEWIPYLLDLHFRIGNGGQI